jgi:DNA-binding CsgD family transcriptional regulator
MRPALCPVLVGRDDEAHQLRAALEHALAGRGGMVLLAGEAGIGKSRLARDLADEARRRDCRVLTGRAVAGGVPTPFRPFAEALAASLRTGGLPDSGALGPFLPALTRLVPHVAPAGSGGGDGSLVFLGEAVLRLLRVLTPAGVCVLLLEDLHWADAETLALVEYLADNMSTEPLLCIGTFRPDEGTDAADLAAKLETRGSADVLWLRRLNTDAVDLMARECLEAGELPAAVRSFVTERADGVPFLVEELLAGLIDGGVLVHRDGRWLATGPTAGRVPATFADAVARRLAAAESHVRLVVGAAAVLGRRFDWSMLSAITGLDDDTVTAALRTGVAMQVIVAGDGDFRFRHALTHEVVLAGLLPPERARLAGLALTAVEAMHPGLQGDWCVTAAGLAERCGDFRRAAVLLVEAGRRDLAVGALASAERTLTHAAELAGEGDAALAVDAGELLTQLYAVSGQVDRAIETGRDLLAKIGTSDPGRSADLHLQIARAAIAGGMWAAADASVRMARELAAGLAGPGQPQVLARVDVCAAQVAVGYEDLTEAMRLADAALRAATEAQVPDLRCEALEVIGRILRQTDTAEAERVYERAAQIAAANGLRLAHVRAEAETAILHMLRTGTLDKIRPARDLAAEHGVLFTTALLDHQIVGILLKDFCAEEALEVASRLAEASQRFHISGRAEAELGRGAAHAMRGERAEMEACITEAVSLMPEDRDTLGCAWGRCRATLSMLEDDLDRAWSDMDSGATLMLVTSAGPAAPFLGLWPLLGAVLGRDADEAVARVRSCHLERNRLIAGLLGCAEAVTLGQRGSPDAAAAAFAAADEQVRGQAAWYWHYARRLTAQAALADGWGEPVRWLRESEAYFRARGDDRIAAGCRRLLRQAGAPVPRRTAGDTQLPMRLRAAGITAREADVLGLLADGLTNREIAERMFLSPRTVEKHVASLLLKTGLRRRSALARYRDGLDG